MFSKLFKKKPTPIPAYARINMRLRPIARGELFEDPLIQALEESGLGEVTGGGSSLGPTGEIEYCGIDIDMFDLAKSPLFICDRLNRRGAPKGSQLIFMDGDKKMVADFGVAEGIAVYFNGTDLPEDIYKTCDINVAMTEINRLIEPEPGGGGNVADFWEGPTESALYLYGVSAQLMKAAIAPFLAAYPLCQRARVVDIA